MLYIQGFNLPEGYFRWRAYVTFPHGLFYQREGGLEEGETASFDPSSWWEPSGILSVQIWTPVGERGDWINILDFVWKDEMFYFWDIDNNILSEGALPPPSQPTAIIAVLPASIVAGSQAILSWVTENATTVYISPLGFREVEGSEVVNPLVTTSYILTASSLIGSVTKSVTLTVTAIPPPPAPTAVLSVSPTTIQPGEAATISWFTENADTIRIAPPGAQVAFAGSYPVWPTETTTYVLTATGPGGTATAQATLTVTSVPPPGDLPAPVIIGPRGILTQARPTFSWQAVPGAVNYEMETSRDSAFITLVNGVQTVFASWTPDSDLATGTWYWRVRAKDATRISAYATASFTITMTPPPTTDSGKALLIGLGLLVAAEALGGKRR